MRITTLKIRIYRPFIVALKPFSLPYWLSGLFMGNALTFNVKTTTSTSQNGQGFSNVPLTAKCSQPVSKNCMPIATYQKMKNLAESLQKAQGTLCALNENGCNTANQDQGATISSAQYRKRAYGFD